MAAVPAFILRRLYVKGSLRNTQDGWCFSLCNTLGSGYAKRMYPLKIDGADVATESTSFEIDGKKNTFSGVNEQNTFALPLNRSIDININGEPLAPGSHKIIMSFEAPGFGRVTFDFADKLAVD